MIPYLQRKPVSFPDPQSALKDPEGLLAAGGDLTPEWLLEAYSSGIFPWYNEPPIFWWSPETRPIINPAHVRINQSLKRAVKRLEGRFTLNHCFNDVIRSCSEPRMIEGERFNQTWINDDIIKAYTELHKLGHAHSVEMWVDNELVGGMYGVQIGANFFGESMFSRADNASKLCFLSFCQFFASKGGQLIDCQMTSPHMQRLGATPVGRSHFLQLIYAHKKIQCDLKGRHILDVYLP